MKKNKFIVIVAFFIGLLLLPSVAYARSSTYAEEIINKIRVTEHEDGSCTYVAKSIPYETLFEEGIMTYQEYVTDWLDPSMSYSEQEKQDMYDDYLYWAKHEIMITANDFSYIPDVISKKVEIEHVLNNDGTITFSLSNWNQETQTTETASKTCNITYAKVDEKVLKEAREYATKIKDEYVVYGLNALSAIYYYGEFDIYKGPNSLVYRYPELKKVLSNKKFNVDMDYIVGCGGTPVTGGCELSGAIRKNGITYATKKIMLSENVVVPVDKDATGTPYEKAEKRIKDHFGEKNIKIELDPEHPDISHMDEEETSFEANALFGTKDREYVGSRANILLNGKRATIVIIEVEKALIDKYEVRANHAESGVNVYTESPDVPIDATIDVEDVKDKDFVKKALNTLKYDLMSAFNIDLLKTTTGVKINEIANGIEVYIPVNNKNKGDKLLVHHIKEDGTLGEKFKGEVVEVDGIKYVKFTTTHFSTYAVLDTSDVDSPDTSDSILISVLLFGLSLITIIESIIAYKKVRKQN